METHTVHYVSPIRIMTIMTVFFALQNVVQLVLSYIFICGRGPTSLTLQGYPEL